MTRHIAVLLTAALAALIFRVPAFAGSTQVLATSDQIPLGGSSPIGHLAYIFLNNNGVVAFSTISATSGIYLAHGTNVTLVAQVGALTPDGIKTYGSVIPYQLTQNNQVVFYCEQGPTFDERFYLADDHSIRLLVRSDESLPDGTGRFLYNDGSANSNGQFAFSSETYDNKNQFSGNHIFLLTGDQLSQIASDGQAGPGGAPFTSIYDYRPAINNSGQILFAATYANGPVFSLVRFDGTTYTELYHSGVSPRGDGTVIALDNYVFNNLGQAAFSVPDIVGDSTVFTNWHPALFRSDGNSLVEVLQSGDPAPGGSGIISTDINPNSRTTQPLFNNAGQLAFLASITGSNGGATDGIGIFITDSTATSLSEVARVGQQAPDGNGFLSFPASLASPLSSTIALNDHGDLAILCQLTGTSGGANDDSALYLWSNGHLVQIAHEGDHLLGSTIQSLRAIQLNNADQVAYGFVLADGRTGVALWSVPEPSSLILFTFALVAMTNTRWRNPTPI